MENSYPSPIMKQLLFIHEYNISQLVHIHQWKQLLFNTCHSVCSFLAERWSESEQQTTVFWKSTSYLMNWSISNHWFPSINDVLIGFSNWRLEEIDTTPVWSVAELWLSPLCWGSGWNHNLTMRRTIGNTHCPPIRSTIIEQTTTDNAAIELR